jgi:transposase-like protein
MARKTCSEEFRRDAVELYRSTPGAAVVGIAADLGLMDSTLSAWLKAAGVAVRGPARRAQASPAHDGDKTPAQEVTRLFVADHSRTFEVKRLYQLVEASRSSCYAWAAGARVNHKRVARVMRAHHLAGVRLRRRVRTTIPEPSNQVVPDLRMRDFTATAPNTKYVGDITYLSCGGGRFLYLATAVDTPLGTSPPSASSSA